MTIRCRSRLCALLFCLPLGLCVAGTAFGASDDDDEEWHDTKGPGGKKLDDDERPKKSKKADADDDKKADEKKSDSDDDKKADEKKSDGDDDKKADEKKSDGDDDKKADEKKSDDDEESGVGAKRKKRAKWKSRGLDSSTKMSFAALGSWGFRDPLGAGLGLRGGAHIAALLPIYVGGVAEYFFGTTSARTSFKGTANENRSERTMRLMYFGAEAGVDVDATADLQLRPYFGLGLGFNRDRTCDSSTDTCHGGSDIHPTITPGIAGLYYLGTVFLGGDLRYLIVPGASSASGAIASATGGVRF